MGRSFREACVSDLALLTNAHERPTGKLNGLESVQERLKNEEGRNGGACRPANEQGPRFGRRSGVALASSRIVAEDPPLTRWLRST
jgi:hypothetical protein